jgi:hypothetical protein
MAAHPVSAIPDLPTGPDPRPETAPADPTDEIRRLAALRDVSQALSGSLNLKTSLDRVLEILGRSRRAS